MSFYIKVLITCSFNFIASSFKSYFKWRTVGCLLATRRARNCNRGTGDSEAHIVDAVILRASAQGHVCSTSSRPLVDHGRSLLPGGLPMALASGVDHRQVSLPGMITWSEHRREKRVRLGPEESFPRLALWQSSAHLPSQKHMAIRTNDSLRPSVAVGHSWCVIPMTPTVIIFGCKKQQTACQSLPRATQASTTHACVQYTGRRTRGPSDAPSSRART